MLYHLKNRLASLGMWNASHELFSWIRFAHVSMEFALLTSRLLLAALGWRIDHQSIPYKGGGVSPHLRCRAGPFNMSLTP